MKTRVAGIVLQMGLAWSQQDVFFCLDAKEPKSQGCTSFFTLQWLEKPKRLKTRLDGCGVSVLFGDSLLLLFKLFADFGSDTDPFFTVFPAPSTKRCKAGTPDYGCVRSHF